MVECSLVRKPAWTLVRGRGVDSFAAPTDLSCGHSCAGMPLFRSCATQLARAYVVLLFAWWAGNKRTPLEEKEIYIYIH